MRARDEQKHRNAPWDPSTLKPELGYIREKPPSPTPPEVEPLWRGTEDDFAAGMVEELIEFGWRLAHLRSQIENLGEEPKGRTRRALAEQLAATYLDQERMTAAVEKLSPEEYHYLVNLLLQSSLQAYYAAPHMQTLWQGFSTPWPKLAQRLQKAGLVLETEEGELFEPYGMLQKMPQIAIPFPTIREPQQVASAPTPHALLSQLQQLLGLLQAETFTLRPRLRWKAPEYPYAQSVTCWPPVPEDARKLYASTEHERVIELWPPEPYLDDAALETWSQALGASRDWVEFLYHVLLRSGIVWPGSPLVVNEELTHAWMALTPGKQLVAVYRAFRHAMPWTSWWPLWREGTVRVRRAYHGYWGLNSLDESLFMSSHTLRWVLLEVLAFLPQDAWIAMSDVYGLLDALFPNPDSHRYLMGLTPRHREGGWAGFLHAVLMRMLTGPLRALGLVDVAPSVEDVSAIRLRGLQDVHWGRTAKVSLEAAGQLQPGAVRVLPQQEGDAPPVLEVETPVPPDFMAFVLRWARPSGFSQNLVRYDLDVNRLHQAFERGEEPASLTETWSSYVQFEAPAEVQAWWQYWWDRYGRVRIYPPQALLQTRDAFTMQEVQVALPDLQSAILAVVTPQAALVKAEEADRLLDDLTRQGYIPKEVS